jgi:hypothetical protein
MREHQLLSIRIIERCSVQLAAQVKGREEIRLQQSFDMWQLGMLVYQMASQPWPWAKPYWLNPGSGGALSDDEILQMLITYNRSADNPKRAKLPHERQPLEIESLRLVVDNLLTPTAEARWTSETLRLHLEMHATTSAR